eukprot:CAMPEP_0179918008 /NCGR_PEP_ID=MMETSP0983-20121128/3158_1 /TAXON_ID=483367 /ORGANISM="non described non described, Strain CCMP 2436" /LENGTH=254 /DNA_ID=CAMNT_0021820823 /DNA_START=72 /DNA_END=838 /DNA_ORIENTATION=+
MSNFCQESRDYAGYARSRVLGRGGKRGGGGDQSQGLSHIDDCHDRAHARNAPQRVLEYGRLLPDAEERQHDARELRPAGPRGVRLGDGLRDELEGIPEYASPDTREHENFAAAYSRCCVDGVKGGVEQEAHFVHALQGGERLRALGVRIHGSHEYLVEPRRMHNALVAAQRRSATAPASIPAAASVPIIALPPADRVRHAHVARNASTCKPLGQRREALATPPGQTPTVTAAAAAAAAAAPRPQGSARALGEQE